MTSEASIGILNRELMPRIARGEDDLLGVQEGGIIHSLKCIPDLVIGIPSGYDLIDLHPSS